MAPNMKGKGCTQVSTLSAYPANIMQLPHYTGQWASVNAVKTASTHHPMPWVPNTCSSTAKKETSANGLQKQWNPTRRPNRWPVEPPRMWAAHPPWSSPVPFLSLRTRTWTPAEHKSGACQCRAKHQRVRPIASKLQMARIWWEPGGVVWTNHSRLSLPTSPVSCTVYSMPSCTIDCL